jgi:AcrR family transcriptional regulator
VIAAAAELFADHGYARTTLARIAEAAGVSPETVQGQGPKAALLISAAEYVAVGVAGEENLLNLEVGRRLIAIQDRDEALDYLVGFVAEVQERTAKLGLALIGGASVDPELDRYLNDFIAGINQQIRRVLGVWRDRGWLREDVSFDELVETSGVICSVDTFLRITHRDGWTVTRYKAWVRRMLAETVFRS